MYKYSRQVRQNLWSDLADFGRLQVQADSMVRFGRFRQIWWFTSTGRLYGQIWQISADYKYKQTLGSDLADFGRYGGLQVQQQTLWFTAVDLVVYRLDVSQCVLN